MALNGMKDGERRLPWFGFGCCSFQEAVTAAAEEPESEPSYRWKGACTTDGRMRYSHVRWLCVRGTESVDAKRYVCISTIFVWPLTGESCS